MALQMRAVRLLGLDEDLPPPPAGYDRRPIGLTAHLVPIGFARESLCGKERGMEPKGAPIGLCLECDAIAALR